MPPRTLNSNNPSPRKRTTAKTSAKKTPPEKILDAPEDKLQDKPVFSSAPAMKPVAPKPFVPKPPVMQKPTRSISSIQDERPLQMSSAKPTVAAPAVEEVPQRRTFGFVVLLGLMLFLSLGVALILLDHANRLALGNQAMIEMETRISSAETAIDTIKARLNESGTPTTNQQSTGQVPATSTTAAPTAENKSPSGTLDRGARSADGTKYAGYDETAGKKGIGVEMIEGGKIRRVVLFTRNESSGAGTAEAANLSVRWKSANVIEYDVLVTKDGKQTKQVQEVEIFF